MSLDVLTFSPWSMTASHKHIPPHRRSVSLSPRSRSALCISIHSGLQRCQHLRGRVREERRTERKGGGQREKGRGWREREREGLVLLRGAGDATQVRHFWLAVCGCEEMNHPSFFKKTSSSPFSSSVPANLIHLHPCPFSTSLTLKAWHKNEREGAGGGRVDTGNRQKDSRGIKWGLKEFLKSQLVKGGIHWKI